MKKILILTLCFLMCFITLTPTAFAKCSHKNTKWETLQEATCTKEGYTGDIYCTDCGEKLSDGKSIPKKDHDYEVKEHKDATCTKAGYTLFICKKCRNEKREEIPAAGHPRGYETKERFAYEEKHP